MDKRLKKKIVEKAIKQAMAKKMVTNMIMSAVTKEIKKETKKVVKKEVIKPAKVKTQPLITKGVIIDLTVGQIEVLGPLKGKNGRYEVKALKKTEFKNLIYSRGQIFDIAYTNLKRYALRTKG